jgi:tryptophanyl-tRNA synthetase
MPLIYNDSILMSIKNMLNVEDDDPAFDTQIGMAINGVFMTLNQLGIGPDEGFAITEANTTWSDFSDDKTLIESVKMYVALKVRMIFDPPASSIVADSINSQIHELEWRLNVQAEKSWENSETNLGDAETI